MKKINKNRLKFPKVFAYTMLLTFSKETLITSVSLEPPVDRNNSLEYSAQKRNRKFTLI